MAQYKAKLKQCANSTNPNCANELKQEYLNLSKAQNEQLKAICQDPTSVECATALNEATWYVNNGANQINTDIISGNGAVVTIPNEFAQDKKDSADAVGIALFNDNYNQDIFADTFTNLEQRQHLFGTLDQIAKNQGHEVEWFGAAEGYSGGNVIFDLSNGNPFMNNETESQWIAEAGDKILTTGYPEFKNLYNTEFSIMGSEAANWDKNWLTKEQTVLQPIHEKYFKDSFLSRSWNNMGLSLDGIAIYNFLNTNDRIKYGCNEFNHGCNE